MIYKYRLNLYLPHNDQRDVVSSNTHVEFGTNNLRTEINRINIMI